VNPIRAAHTVSGAPDGNVTAYCVRGSDWAWAILSGSLFIFRTRDINVGVLNYSNAAAPGVAANAS